jgi:hypothetical protein
LIFSASLKPGSILILHLLSLIRFYLLLSISPTALVLKAGVVGLASSLTIKFLYSMSRFQNTLLLKFNAFLSLFVLQFDHCP